MSNQNDPPQIVAGKTVTDKWLSSQPDPESYRACLHLAFEKAQLQYKLRQQQKLNQSSSSAQQSMQKRVKEIEQPSALTAALKQEYATVNPEFPQINVGEKLKLVKLSRSCNKKVLERFFHIDPEQETLVYYGKEQDKKPKKAVSLADCRVKVETLASYNAQYNTDQKKRDALKTPSGWAEIDKAFRMSISVQSRKFIPVYHYTESLHSSITIKAVIDRLCMSQEEKHQFKSSLALVTNLQKITNGEQFLSGCLKLMLKKRQTTKLLSKLTTISKYHFEVEAPETLKVFLGQPPLQRIEEEKKVVVPDLHSTLRYGQVHPSKEGFKSYSRTQRLILTRLVNLCKRRRRERYPEHQALINLRNSQSHFKVAQHSGNQYHVHQAILENAREEDLPYPMPYKIESIDSIKIEKDNLVVADKKRNEHSIPLSEIAFMGSKGSKLQLRGRKLNPSQDMTNSILPQQLGYECIKYSRLQEKQVLTISLKKLQIPQQVIERFTKQVHNQRADQVLYRFTIKIGNFYCNSTLFSADNLKDRTATIDLKEEITVDMHEGTKHAKLSLIAMTGRKSGNSNKNASLFNELQKETIITSVNLKLQDFQLPGINLMHIIPLNDSLYSPLQELPAIQDSDQIYLTTIIHIKTAPGHIDSAPMEGPQLLIGKHALYRNQFVAKALTVNKNHTCKIEILPTQPGVDKVPNKIIDNVQIKQDLTLIERYGISHFDLDEAPQNYNNGQYEWSLSMNMESQSARELLCVKINQAIANSQAKTMFDQRIAGMVKKANKNLSQLVTGNLFLSILNAYNLQNSSGNQCDSFIQITISKGQSMELLLDLADQDSFIECQNQLNNGDKHFTTEVVAQNNNPNWVSKDQAHGTVFNLGKFMLKKPNNILLEVLSKRKKSVFSSELENELLGTAEITTEQLLEIGNYGQEFYLFLNNSLNPNSIIRLRSLFVPSNGTIERKNLDPSASVFKSCQHFLLYKILHMANIYDQFGYLVPLGSYYLAAAHKKYLKHGRNELEESKRGETLLQRVINRGSQAHNSDNRLETDKALSLDDSYIQKRVEKYSPVHHRGTQLQEMAGGKMRPKLEENMFTFQQLWVYYGFLPKSKALQERHAKLWQQYIASIEASPDEKGQVDDELKSIRSRFSNTAKMVNEFKYRKKTSRAGEQEELKTSQNAGGKFSALLVGDWQKDDSWKYIDIWHLIKSGIPSELRGSLWKDLLKASIHEQQAYVYFNNGSQSSFSDNPFVNGVSVYENMKTFSSKYDSKIVHQIEEDLKAYQFPDDYLGNLSAQDRGSKLEVERLQIFNILKAFTYWAVIFLKNRKKVTIFNRGFIGILQRLLSFNTEEDAFWCLIGLVKSMKNVFNFEIKQIHQDQACTAGEIYEQLCPLTNRKVCFKNEMIIINCTLRIHFPEVYAHLKSLSMPIEWYFYESLASFFSTEYSSEIILRLWDMIILNLSTTEDKLRKRALWYLLAVPLYQVQTSAELILQTHDPVIVKDIIRQGSQQGCHDPDAFIDTILGIIKHVFVVREDMYNKLFKGDEASQLEQMRLVTEQEFALLHKESQMKSKKMGREILERGIQLNLNSISGSRMKPNGSIDADFDLFQFEMDELMRQQLIEGRQQLANNHFGTLEQAKIEAASEIIKKMFATSNPNEITMIERFQGSNKDPLQASYQSLTAVLNQLPQVVQTLNIQQDIMANSTRQIAKIFAHGQNLTASQLLQALFTLFKPNSIADVAKIVHHIFQASHYPIPMNEVLQLVNVAMYGNSIQIVSVTQQASSNGEDGLFDRIFKAAKGQGSYDVTHAFKAILNSLIRQTGIYSHIDFSIAPFNNINFWLGTQNNLRRSRQTIFITVQDQNGTQQKPFIFNFDADGLFIKGTGSQILVLQSQVNIGQANQEQFSDIKLLADSIIRKMPMLSSIISQELFFKNQIQGMNDLIVEASRTYQFIINTQKTEFKITFDPRRDRNNDFTVQDMLKNRKLQNKDIANIYKKTNEGNKTVVNISLSAISEEDTFIIVKNRIQIALKYIEQVEASLDVPNVQAMRVKSYNSFDRIMKVVPPQETLFQLTYHEPEKDPISQYNSYALFTHPNGVQQWRPCKILSRNVNGNNEMVKISYLHERNQGNPILEKSVTLPRHEVLLSFEYKRNQADYYSAEVKELLASLNRDDEPDLALFQKENAQKNGAIEAVRRINFDAAAAKGMASSDRDLRISNQGLFQNAHPEELEEIQEIERSMLQ